MAIFPTLEIESIVQTGDKTRLDASKSYVTPNEDAVATIEINPDGSGYIDCTASGFLDWGYSSTGIKTVTTKVTTEGGTFSTQTSTILVISEVDDYLFSNDQDLRLHVPDVLKYIPDGKSSYKNIHRRAQSMILDYLDEQGVRDKNDARLTKAAFVDKQEVKEWSTFLSLRLIFDGLWNTREDVFFARAREFEKSERSARDRFIRLDLDNDGDAESTEGVRIYSGTVVRR